MKSLILTYLIAYGGALIAPFLPFIGVCLYISLSILKPTKTWEWAVPDGPYSKVLAVAFILGWCFKRFGKWNFGKAKPIVLCFTAFVCWSVLSMMLVANNQVLASNFVELMLKIFIPFLVAMTLVDSVVKLKILAWSIVLSFGVVAFEENLFYLTQGHVPGGVGMNGISHEMATGVGLAIFLGLYSEKTWQKWLCWVIAILLAHVPLMHMSRGAMLGLLVTGIIGVYKMPKNRQTISLLILALIAASIIAGPSVVEEFSTIFASAEERDGSAQSRFDLWADMLTVAFSNPILGIGPGNWPTMSEQFGWFSGKQGHGLWIQYCAELGFVGAGLILAFYLVCIIRLLRISNQFMETNNWLLAPLIGVPASVSAWLVEAQFGSFWAIETPFYLILLGAATLRVISVDLPLKKSKDEELEPSMPEQTTTSVLDNPSKSIDFII